MGARAGLPLRFVAYQQTDAANTAAPEAAKSGSGIFLGLGSQGRQRVMQLVWCRKWRETSLKGTDGLGRRCWFGCGVGPVSKQVLAAMLVDLRRVYEKGLPPVNFKRPLTSNIRALWDSVCHYLCMTDDDVLEAFGAHVPRKILAAEVAAGFSLRPAPGQRHSFPVNQHQADMSPNSQASKHTHRSSAPLLFYALQADTGSNSMCDRRSQRRSANALAETLPGAKIAWCTQQQVAGPQQQAHPGPEAAFCPTRPFHAAICPRPVAIGPVHWQPAEQLSAQGHHAAVHVQLACLSLGLAPAAPSSRHSHEMGSLQRQKQPCSSLLAALHDDHDTHMYGVLVPPVRVSPVLQHQAQQQLSRTMMITDLADAQCSLQCAISCILSCASCCMHCSSVAAQSCMPCQAYQCCDGLMLLLLMVHCRQTPMLLLCASLLAAAASSALLITWASALLISPMQRHGKWPLSAASSYP